MNTAARREAIECLRVLLTAKREAMHPWREALPPHSVFRPNFESYERRFDEIETFMERDTDVDLVRAADLYDDLMLDIEADHATVRAEVEARMVRFLDEIGERIEERKFEMPAEVRNELEDMMQPYHDGIREKMLANLPIDTRRDVEASKRRPDE